MSNNQYYAMICNEFNSMADMFKLSANKQMQNHYENLSLKMAKNIEVSQFEIL
tara:strand:+ start:845 stop:1003 length:159 start_codon:yes stop_codon:yes gene_type:complete